MMFLRRQLPVVIAFVLGMFTLVIFYIPAAPMQGIGDRLKIFVTIIGASNEEGEDGEHRGLHRHQYPEEHPVECTLGILQAAPGVVGCRALRRR